MMSPPRLGPSVLCSLAAWAALSVGPATAADPPRTVSGVVVDEAGRPVAGVTVESAGWVRLEPGRTDAEGRFALSVLVDAHANLAVLPLLARAPDGRLGYQPGRLGPPAATPDRIVVKPARPLAVRVVDDAGRPVAGAEVTFGARFGLISQGESAADGNWSATIPTDAPDWKCLARKAGVGFDYAQAERARGSSEPPTPLPDRLTLTLDGARPPVAVRAVGLRDEPLAGVQVRVLILQKPGKEASLNLSSASGLVATTDADGRASLDWIPAKLEGGFGVTAGSDQLAPTNSALFSSEQPDGGREFRFVMTPLERIAGRITDVEGRPAPGAEVVATGRGFGSAQFRRAVRTDADGRYSFRAPSEMAFILRASRGDEAAPHRTDLLLRAGRPLDGVDLRLGPATRFHGRVTTGTAGKPAPGQSITLRLQGAPIPPELRRPEARTRDASPTTAYFEARTDADGRFEVGLAPGEYEVAGLPRVPREKLTMPADAPQAEVVRNYTLPRADEGPFRLVAVDPAGRPLAGAKVDGSYTATTEWHHFDPQRADAAGVAAFTRKLDPMLVHVASPDGALAVVARFEPDAAEGRVVGVPTAAARGRLVDPAGRPIPKLEFEYGVRVPHGKGRFAASGQEFGGTAATDDAGRFALPALVVGQPYDITVSHAGENRVSSVREAVRPAAAGPLDVGDVAIDLAPPKPYVPPTPAERTAEAFAAAPPRPWADRLAALLDEARREYTRPLVLVGAKDDPACVELFRLLNEPSDLISGDKSRPRTPADLRWEFELASVDRDDPAARDLAAGVEPPALVALDDAGRPAASYPLRLGPDGRLDAPGLASFLLARKLPTRDASAMLDAALAAAKADGKPVFLDFSASWCPPCRRLARFLDANKADFAAMYHIVKLDYGRDDHAVALWKRFPEAAHSGVPWFVVLDPAGRPLADSNAPRPADYEEGDNLNIGFPSDKPGIDHFLDVIRRTAPGVAPATLDRLRSKLAR